MFDSNCDKIFFYSNIIILIMFLWIVIYKKIKICLILRTEGKDINKNVNNLNDKKFKWNYE